MNDVSSKCKGIVSKQGWDAMPVTKIFTIDHPIPLVFVHHIHDIDMPSCYTRQSCENSVRKIQKQHIVELGMDRCTFLISEA